MDLSKIFISRSCLETHT